MSQKYTSANTSINKNKLPAVYNKIDFSKITDSLGYGVIDWGCGKYDNGKEFIENEWCGEWYGYDPYNRTEQENENTMSILRTRSCDSFCIICSNVLNVIDSDDTISSIANNITSSNAPYFITIWDGDRSGEGRPTMDDCYQRNEKIKSYLRFFPDAVIRKGVITNHPEAIF